MLIFTPEVLTWPRGTACENGRLNQLGSLSWNTSTWNQQHFQMWKWTRFRAAVHFVAWQKGFGSTSTSQQTFFYQHACFQWGWTWPLFLSRFYTWSVLGLRLITVMQSHRNTCRSLLHISTSISSVCLVTTPPPDFVMMTCKHVSRTTAAGNQAEPWKSADDDWVSLHESYFLRILQLMSWLFVSSSPFLLRMWWPKASLFVFFFFPRLRNLLTTQVIKSISENCWLPLEASGAQISAWIKRREKKKAARMMMPLFREAGVCSHSASSFLVSGFHHRVAVLRVYVIRMHKRKKKKKKTSDQKSDQVLIRLGIYNRRWAVTQHVTTEQKNWDKIF